MAVIPATTSLFRSAGPGRCTARVAEELGLQTICIPPNAGVPSAYGLLAADYVRYETWTRRVAVDPAAPDTVRAVFAQMREALREGFARLGIDRSPSFTIQLDMRLVGQAFEVAVAIPVECLGDLTTCGLFDRFRDAHHRVFEFGESDHDRAEIVSFRLGAAVAPDANPHSPGLTIRLRPRRPPSPSSIGARSFHACC